jgi:hypothetical protein
MCTIYFSIKELHCAHGVYLCTSRDLQYKQFCVLELHYIEKHWVCGPCVSAGILNTRKHSVSKTGSLSRLEMFYNLYVGSGSRTPELYSVSPDWFEYCFIYGKFIGCREF